MSYYAVKNGKKPGIYRDWKTTELQVKGFPGAIYKKFSTQKEAESFLNDESSSETEQEEGKIVAYTDGSCSSEQGGYAFLIITDEEIDEHYGKVPNAPCTNNIAELYAIYRCLKKLIKMGYSEAEIRPDSRYAMDSVTSYIKKWKKNGWRTTNGEPVKNQDLIKKIDVLLQEIKVVFVHVKAHGSDKYNERVDELANLGRIE